MDNLDGEDGEFGHHRHHRGGEMKGGGRGFEKHGEPGRPVRG